MIFKKLNRLTKVFLSIQAIGMLMGTSTHLQWVLKNGFLSDEYHAPLLSKVFWDSLTFLDPLAAILLFLRPKAGIVLTLVIISVDVIHNNLFYLDELYINAPELSVWVQRYWMILGQFIFLLFVYATFKHNSKSIRVQSNKNQV